MNFYEAISGFFYDILLGIINVLPTASIPVPLQTALQYIFDMAFSFDEFLPVTEALTVLQFIILLESGLLLFRISVWIGEKLRLLQT